MKIKLLIPFLFWIAFTNQSKAQNKIERFCRIIVTEKKQIVQNIDIDYGENPRLINFKDTTIISDLKKVKLYSNSIDVLNYMNSLGWVYIDETWSLKQYQPFILDRYVYLFKKIFQPQELL